MERVIIINRDTDEGDEKADLKQTTASPAEKHQSWYLSSRVTAECKDILDDIRAVCMFFDVIKFMERMYKKKNKSIEQAAKLYKDMTKELMSTAEKVFKLFMDDYLVHFDDVSNEAIHFASASRHIPDYVADEHTKIYELYERMVSIPEKQNRGRYYRLREKMVAECRDLLGDYEAMEIVFNIVFFMRKELLHGIGSKCGKKTSECQKKFLVLRMKRCYFHKIQKVIPIAKKVFMFLFKEYIIHSNQRVADAYISATSRLIYTSDGWE